MSNEEIMAYVKVLFQNLFGGTEEKHEEPQELYMSENLSTIY
jgi:hypothetical protein